ncbi:MAG: glycerophosphodiester phosphodiesterase family protein [Flavobacteriales bacterium]|nr:glycerophosphodiester phosphodiesterase family protein [Flavobacteriales bacterium]
MNFRLFTLSLCVALGGCCSASKREADAGPKPAEPASIDLQGHRGCRGLRPENTWEAFKHAIDLGVTTIECDVVLSKDSALIVSHEPWINSEICHWDVDSRGEQGLNIFKMSADEVASIACGTLGHAQFPEQKQSRTYKPQLREVIEKTIAYCDLHQRKVPGFNVEIKSRPEWEGHFQPEPAAYVDQFLRTFNSLTYSGHFTVQSFDPRILRILHDRAPEVELVYLTYDKEDSPEKAIQTLGFTPVAYSPDFKLVDSITRDACTALGMELVVWTVNEPDDIQRMAELGVDGIISDYPNRVLDYARISGLQIR